MIKTALALTAAAALSLGAAAVPASASAACSFDRGGTTYGVDHVKVGCAFAKRESRKMVNGGAGPRGWRCVKNVTYSTGTCKKRRVNGFKRPTFSYKILAEPASVHARGNWA